MKLNISIISIILLLLSSQVTAEVQDSRTEIQIPAKFKPQILADMRKNLEVTQGIVSALAREDFEQVEKLASTLGRMEHSEELKQRRKLMPVGFRALGPKMHLGFQAISRDARDFGDVQHTLEQLSELMAICTACHNTYRLEIK